MTNQTVILLGQANVSAGSIQEPTCASQIESRRARCNEAQTCGTQIEVGYLSEHESTSCFSNSWCQHRQRLAHSSARDGASRREWRTDANEAYATHQRRSRTAITGSCSNHYRAVEHHAKSAGCNCCQARENGPNVAGAHCCAGSAACRKRYRHRHDAAASCPTRQWQPTSRTSWHAASGDKLSFHRTCCVASYTNPGVSLRPGSVAHCRHFDAAAASDPETVSSCRSASSLTLASEYHYHTAAYAPHIANRAHHFARAVYGTAIQNVCHSEWRTFDSARYTIPR